MCHVDVSAEFPSAFSPQKKIKTYDESYCEDAIVRVVFNFSEPGEEISRKSRSMEIEDRSGQPGKETDLFESFSSTD